MKFKCLNENCGKTFVYAAKTRKPIDTEAKALTTAAGSLQVTESFVETHVCPYCNSRDFTEYTEPQPEITSVKSVPLEDVDELLAQGYVVEQLYAKTATLAKRGEVKQSES